MGNACCTDRRNQDIAKDESRIPFRAETLKITPTEDSFEEFGSKLRDKHFVINQKIANSIKKYGLYTYEHSVADLRGSEALPVKLAINEDIVYYGQMLGSKMYGKGHMQTKAGDLYVCSFYKGQARGTGAVYFTNGNYYFGRLVQGDLEEGKMIYSDGTEYQGQFMNSKRSGNGSMKYLDGRRFEGQWMNDLENGPGKIITYGFWNDGKLVSQDNNQHNMQMTPDENAIIQSPIRSVNALKPISIYSIDQTEELDSASASQFSQK